jgi:hypothetical protein
VSIVFSTFSSRGRRYQPRRAAVKSMPARSEAKAEPSIAICGLSPSNGGS